MLTILSGKFKGHKLEVPKTGTRPTSSQVKKALFDTLRPQIEDLVVCDLFAGSGSIGLEALSQGASFCYFIEASKNAFLALKRNCERLKIENQCRVELSKAIAFLKKNPNLLITIDLFYIDPPYEIPANDSSSYESLMAFFEKAELKSGALLVFETKDPSRIEKPLAMQEALVIRQKKHYGDTHLFFLEKN